MQGNVEETNLIAAAQSVAASTAQLLMACQVKADARSENNRRLQVRREDGGGGGGECETLSEGARFCGVAIVFFPNLFAPLSDE